MNLIFLGDSLIEYYDWQGRFPGHRAANLGVAGESVEGLMSRVMKIRESAPEADVILIMSGTNNVAMDDLEFPEFYRVILEKLNVFYPGAKIITHSLPPTMVDFISNESIIKVNDALKKLAKDSGAEYLDIYARFVDTGGSTIKEYLLDDGIHLSSEGYRVWANALEKIIQNE
ncbi:MAG: GDSL-type esterase/lipase family protein [Nitrospirota bacterium]